MYFEDYLPGVVTELGSFRVDEDEIVSFGRRYDPQPFHVDPVAAADGPYGGLIASGWMTCALTMRVLVSDYLSPESSLGSPGLDELRWSAPARPGDELTVQVTVLQARSSASKPDRGIIRSRIEARNQDGELVLSMIAVNLVLRRP